MYSWLWWLYGGYVFPVVVKPENLPFYVKFDLEGHSQIPPKTIGILTKLFAPLVQIWLSYFERFTSYVVEKLNMG